MTVIKPTIGRVVHFYFSKFRKDGQPQAAIISYVHSDNRVNLAAFDKNGSSYPAKGIQLVQEGEALPEQLPYATWMPYQIGQAKKEEVKPTTVPSAVKAVGDVVEKEAANLAASVIGSLTSKVLSSK